jgi:hypothetical protein
MDEFIGKTFVIEKETPVSGWFKVKGVNWSFAQCMFENPTQKPTSKGGEQQMQEIKSGDRIRLAYDSCVNKGDYTVFDDNGNLAIQQEGGNTCHCDSEWTIISSANNTMTVYRELTDFQREHWDVETKALYQMGIIDSNGNIDSSSRLLEALMKVNFKSLASNAMAEVAKAEAEAKKAKKQG